LSTAAANWKNKFLAVLSGKEEGTISEQDMKKFRQEESSLEVHIYSDSKSNIEKCKKELEAKLEESYIKKKIEDYKELIKTLKADEVHEFHVFFIFYSFLLFLTIPYNLVKLDTFSVPYRLNWRCF
jgi:hypothetical protein